MCLHLQVIELPLVNVLPGIISLETNMIDKLFRFSFASCKDVELMTSFRNLSSHITVAARDHSAFVTRGAGFISQQYSHMN